MADELDKLIEQSKDKTMIIGTSRRRTAVKKLGEIGSPKSVMPLVQALDDEDNDVKRLAFLGLNSLKDYSAQEVLRSIYLKSKKKTLWQIIKKNRFYPQEIAEKLDFFVQVKAQDEIKDLVTKDNFEEILQLILDSSIENKAETILTIVDSGGEDTEMIVVKKFLSTKSDDLFSVIDQRNWYPNDLDKKIMFLLKTERYQKLSEMLDGADFRELLDILTNPKFPMKKQAWECLSHVSNPIIIDEICQIFLNENVKHLAPLILQNNWSPNHPRDKIFFYLKTPFLKGYFLSVNIDAQMIGGYLSVPHVRKSIRDYELTPLANYLSYIAAALSSGEKPETASDNPLLEMKKRVTEYMEHPKTPEIINEICNDFLANKEPFLGYLILQMGWAPEELDDKVRFFLLSGQDQKAAKMGEKVIETLFELFTGEDKELKEKAASIIKNTKDPKSIDKLFRLYFSSMNKELEAIIKENNWEPSDKMEKTLYYVFSGQPEKYLEIEPKGYSIIFEAYKTLDTSERFKLIETLIKHKADYLIDFYLHLFTYEKNPRTLKLLCVIIPVFFDKVYQPLNDMLKRMEGTALQEIIKTLAELKTHGSLEMLYEIAVVKKGYTCLWILKLLEEARWQPQDPRERAFFYELFKIRDEMVRMLKNNIVNEDPRVREQAAYDFSKMGDERLLTTLMKYTEDPDDHVRMAVSYSIGKLCAFSPENALKQIDSFRIGSIYMIFNDVKKAFMVQSDLEQMQILSRNYQVGNIVLRIFSIAAFEGLQKKEGVPTLLQAIQDKDKLVSTTALKALIGIADSQAEIPLLKMIGHDDKEIRMLVAEALANVASSQTVKKLLKMINTGEYTYADSIILALGKINAEAHRHLFERVIQRPEFSFEGKRAAILALGNIKDEEVAATLITYMKNAEMVSGKDKDLIPYVDALGSIGSPSSYSELIRIMSNASWDLKRHIIRAMGNINSREALVTIIKALENQNSWVQIEAVDSLANYLNQYFKFKGTQKDLQFVGAIVGRLMKFKLNELADSRAEEIIQLVNLSVLLLKHRFTKLYVEQKTKLMGAGKTNQPK